MGLLETARTGVDGDHGGAGVDGVCEDEGAGAPTGAKCKALPALATMAAMRPPKHKAFKVPTMSRPLLR